MKLWLTKTKNKCFVKMSWHLLSECVKTTVLLICSSGTVATVATTFFFFFVQSSICTFFFSFYIYCYTDTINFTIFSQLLRCQFLISQNKIIKYETVTNTTKNKYFVKMLWHLLGECVKVTALLVCSICTVHQIFFSHRFVLFFSIYKNSK